MASLSAELGLIAMVFINLNPFLVKSLLESFTPAMNVGSKSFNSSLSISPSALLKWLHINIIGPFIPLIFS